ncbi:MAG TPA: alpha/beta fold hydrolase [Trebonia sp.]|nr:alpha/beta fold hydrolase [Trebonia sp.]
MNTQSSPWLRRLTDARHERIVIVLPAAGARAAMFRPWAQAIGARAELGVVTPPGREHRFAEPPFQHVDPIADAVAAEIVALDRRVTLFGHSAGALVALEVAGRVRGGGVDHVIVAAATPPDMAEANYALMNDAELIKALRAWGGTPSEVLDDPAMVELFLPGLRADLAVAHSCRAARAHPILEIPVTALVGSSDRFATPDQAAGWSRFTTAPFAFATVNGGHFFPVTNSSEVVARVVATFAAPKAAPPVDAG